MRRGLLFRSEMIVRSTEDDVAALIALNIVLVCDLRSARERSHVPNSFWIERGIERLDFDVLGGIPPESNPWQLLRANPDVDGAMAAMERVYAAMPAAAAPLVRMIFERIAADDLPLLIHCTAGKDRTGFIAAFILASIGVGTSAIVSDYLASRGRRTEVTTQATRTMVREHAGERVSDKAIETMMSVDEAYLTRSFAVIDHDYGGLSGYLSFAGIDIALLERVRDRLLE